MYTSAQWIEYFSSNLCAQRIDWCQPPRISEQEIRIILKSLQAWQLGESSDGRHLLKAAGQYASRTGDSLYVDAVSLFIKEEQKHGNHLGRYLDLIHRPRIKKNWGDTLFRKIRYLNASMESWTLAVITVESAAQIFYQSMKDATGCPLLKQICTDILIDEAPHIRFQRDRLGIIFQSRGGLHRLICYWFYMVFFFLTAVIVWLAHRQLFLKGGYGFLRYLKKMILKSDKTIGRLKRELEQPAAALSPDNTFQ